MEEALQETVEAPETVLFTGDPDPLSFGGMRICYGKVCGGSGGQLRAADRRESG